MSSWKNRRNARKVMKKALKAWLKQKEDKDKLKLIDVFAVGITGAIGFVTGWESMCENAFAHFLRNERKWDADYLIFIYEYAHQYGHILRAVRNGAPPEAPLVILPPGFRPHEDNPFADPEKDPEYH